VTTPATSKGPTLNERAHAILDQKAKLKADGWKFRDYADGRMLATHKARGLKTGKHDSMVEVINEAARLAEERTAEVEGDGLPAEPVEAGTPEAEKELQALRELYGHTEPTADEREQKIEERGGQVNEHGVYVEGVETVTVKTTKKLGRVELQVVQDRVDGKWRHGIRYDLGGRAPWFDNGTVVGQPFDTREEALAAAALEVARVKPELSSYMEQFVAGLDLPTPAEAIDPTPYAPEGVGEPGDEAAAGDVVESDLKDQLVEHVNGNGAEPRIYRETVEVKLNDHDVAAKARELSLLRVQIEELQGEMQKTVKGYKDKLAGLEEKCAELFRTIRNGHDELDLEVFERRDYENHMVELRRADTCEIVSTRAMKPTEYQQRLPAV
jgi:hypothetical protein